MMADCALEPRSVTAASVGQEKNTASHNLTSQLNESEQFSNEIFKTAYGLKGLGMPLKGLKANINNLNAYTLQSFQLDHIRPEKLTICGAGIESHQEFVDLVVSKLGGLPKSDQVSEREAAGYQGGEVRNLNDASTTHLSLVFEGANYKSSDFYALKLAEIILGNAEFGRLNALFHQHRELETGKAVQANF